MALVSSPSTGSHGRFTLRKPQLPLFTCEPPYSRRWQFASFDRCKSRSPFPLFFFFFNLHSCKLSYPIPWNFFNFFFFFFCYQVCRRLTLWFWLSFSSKKPSWPPNLKQGLPAISSHYHFLFFIFLIKPNVILFIHLLFNHLSPTTSMWTPWEDKPYISCSPLIPSALKDRCMVDVKKHLFKNNS